MLEDLPQLLRAMKIDARFQEERLGADAEKADFVFELSWHRPERSTPPLDLLTVVDARFHIKSFELTTENGR